VKTSKERRADVTYEIERQEVFRDHFEDCLMHFANRFNAKMPQGKKGLVEARKPIADFCGASDATVRSWLSDCERRLPMGGLELKLKCFLDLNGYRIIEFERLPKVIRNFAELIGFGILSIEEAGEVLGFSKCSTLYPILSQKGRDTGISKVKESKMFDIWKERKGELEHKKKEALKHYRLDFLNQASSPAMSQPLLFPTKGGTAAVRRSAVLTILEGLLALLEGSFDELSESELADLKEHYDGNILQLATRLSDLSSKLTASDERSH
jgi:hypothetical protein